MRSRGKKHIAAGFGRWRQGSCWRTAPGDLICTTSDGVRIAYTAVGNGPPLVKTANWLNHLEYDWQCPIWSHLLRSLASRYRLVRYDERGNGLSDWDVCDISLDAFVTDLETVSDTVGLKKFPLLGISQGVPSP